MKVSANEASKRVGKSPPTISRAIKSGKLSCEKVEGGGYLIDEAELYRVWPRVTPKDDMKDNVLNGETPSNPQVFEVEIAFMRERLAEKDGIISDLKDQRDKWQGQAERMLIDRPIQQTVPAAKSGLFARLFGRN